MRRSLVLAGVLAACTAFADLPPSLQRLAASAGLRQATIAVKAAYVSGGTLVRHNDKRLMVPASNQKLLTSAAALEVMGRSYVFTTTLRAKWDDSVALLTLVGGGDPLLTHAQVREMVAKLRRQGMPDKPAVRLDLTRYDTKPYGPAWQLDDLGYYYEPPILSLAIDEDAAKVLATPTKVGSPPKIAVAPPLGFVTIKNQAKTGKGAAIEVTREADRDIYTVTGCLSPNAKPNTMIQKIAVASIADLARWAVENALSRHPRSAGSQPGGGAEATQSSKPLAKIVVALNKESDNLIAEMLFKELGYRAFRKGTWKSGAIALKRALAKMGISGFTIADGSGLSREDGVTADGMTHLLLYATTRPWYTTFRTSLPVAGTDGTLKHRLPKLKGRVFAKTGTMKRVSSLSGYLSPRSGRLIAFSILVNQAEVPAARRFEDAVVTWLDHDTEALAWFKKAHSHPTSSSRAPKGR